MLLGLGGYSTAGKDAVADYLVDGRGWKKLFMSQFLLEAMLKLNPVIWVPSELHSVMGTDILKWHRYQYVYENCGYEKSKEIPQVREFLQKLGTEVGRDMFGENVWVDMIFNKAKALMYEGHNVVVTGIRFPNELTAVRAKRINGIDAWVDRPGVSAVNSHTSDNSLGPDDFNFKIDNDGGLEDLPHIVDEFLDETLLNVLLGE